MTIEDGNGIPPELLNNISGEKDHRSIVTIGSGIDRNLAVFMTLSSEELVEREKEFVSCIDIAMASLDGLPMIEGFDFDSEQSSFWVETFENLLLSREGSIYQPYSNTESVLEEITKGAIAVRAMERQKSQNPAREIDKKADALLIEQYSRITARRLLRTMYRQRQLLSEDAGGEDKSLKEGRDPLFRPLEFGDRTTWMGILKGEFGTLVDKGLRQIVRIGQEGIKDEEGRIVLENPYANGITDPNHFRLLLNSLSEACNGRMDAAVTAWRLASIWEIFARYGAATEEKGGKFEFKLGDSIFVSDRWATTAYLDIQRLIESGCTVDREMGWKEIQELLENPTEIRRILLNSRTSPEKMSYNKIGSPITLGRGMQSILPENYLESVKVKVGGKKTSFFELWWDSERKLGDLPWRETERVAAGIEEPAPLGSYQYWRLINGMRALGVAEIIKRIPSAGDLVKPDTWWSLNRNFNKTGIDRSARKWLVLGWMYVYSQPGPTDKTPEEQRALGVQVLTRSERFENLPASADNVRGTTPTLVISQAIRSNFISPEEGKWILSRLTKSPQELIKERP